MFLSKKLLLTGLAMTLISTSYWQQNDYLSSVYSSSPNVQVAINNRGFIVKVYLYEDTSEYDYGYRLNIEYTDPENKTVIGYQKILNNIIENIELDLNDNNQFSVTFADVAAGNIYLYMGAFDDELKNISYQSSMYSGWPSDTYYECFNPKSRINHIGQIMLIYNCNVNGENILYSSYLDQVYNPLYSEVIIDKNVNNFQKEGIAFFQNGNFEVVYEIRGLVYTKTFSTETRKWSENATLISDYNSYGTYPQIKINDVQKIKYFWINESIDNKNESIGYREIENNNLKDIKYLFERSDADILEFDAVIDETNDTTAVIIRQEVLNEVSFEKIFLIHSTEPYVNWNGIKLSEGSDTINEKFSIPKVQFGKSGSSIFGAWYKNDLTNQTSTLETSMIDIFSTPNRNTFLVETILGLDLESGIVKSNLFENVSLCVLNRNVVVPSELSISINSDNKMITGFEKTSNENDTCKYTGYFTKSTN